MSVWCEHCQDHYPESHYTDEGHKIGPEWGPTGWEMFVIRAVWSSDNDGKTVGQLRAELEAEREARS